MTKRTVSKVLVVCMIIAAMFTFAGCSATDLAAAALKRGDLEKAIELYEEKIEGDYELQEELAEAGNVYLDEVYEKLNNGKITADEARAIAQNYNSFTADYYFMDRAREINRLADSKDYFEQAEEYMTGENPDYFSAIEYYLWVIEGDSNYATAQQRAQEAYDKFVDYAISVAETYVGGQDYSTAIEILDEAADALSDFGVNSSDKLDEKREEYVQAKEEAEINEYIDAANSDIQNGDYYTAIDRMRGAVYAWPDNSRVAEAFQNAQRSLVNYALDEAANLFTTNGDYTSAMTAVESAAGNIDDENMKNLLAEAYNYYKSFVPVPLGEKNTYYDDCDDIVYRANGYGKYDRTDNIGNEYDSAYWIKDDADSYAVYNVSDYDYLVCTAYVPARYKNFSCGCVNFSLDGSLAYQTQQMGVGSYPEQVTLSLNGATELKISYSNLEKHREDNFSLLEYTRCNLGNAYLCRSTDGAAAFTQRA
jgi:hypothetical protein